MFQSHHSSHISLLLNSADVQMLFCNYSNHLLQEFIGQRLCAHLDLVTVHARHFEFINVLVEQRLKREEKNNTKKHKQKLHVHVWESKQKKFDLPFLPCRIPSSTPSLSETRSLDSSCLIPAEQRQEEDWGKKKKKKEQRWEHRIPQTPTQTYEGPVLLVKLNN